MNMPRIPAALQAIFMASNQGQEVHEAPKEADKVYGSSTADRRPNTRIPLSLQNVFVQSNQGFEVHEPPADKSANKVYRRIWRRQRAEVSPWACLPANYHEVRVFFAPPKTYLFAPFPWTMNLAHTTLLFLPHDDRLRLRISLTICWKTVVICLFSTKPRPRLTTQSQPNIKCPVTELA